MRNTSEILSSSEEETIQLGRTIGRILQPGDTIMLVGELGSGKTRIAKGIVSAAAGVSPDDVVSPTFTLINRFDGDFPVHHADLYRVEGGEVDGLGLEDAIEEGGAVVIEWAEKIPEPEEDALKVLMYDMDRTDSRRIVFEWLHGGSWDRRMDSILREWATNRI
jgi:tRNA threonylcarbamoyladenosine biosynthesis protein TsaE